MTATTTIQGYGDGITHPANRPSSLQRHTITLLHLRTPHISHLARNLRCRDIVAAPYAVHTDAVSVVKDDDNNTPLQPLSTSPRAKGNTASNGFSNKLKSSRQNLSVHLDAHHNDDESRSSTIHEQIDLYLSATALILDAALRDFEHRDRKQQPTQQHRS